jgi:putative membrane protein
MDTTGMMGGAVPPAAEAAPPAGATTALSAQQVSAVLSASDSAEIKPSQLAQQKAQNAEVKAYAQRMLKDHGMLEDSLRALDKRENVSPAPNPVSQQLESQTESTMTRLQSLSGAEFDQAYMQAMVQSHTEALNVVDNQLLPATQDPQLRVAISQKVRPTIVSHLDAARQIQQSLASGGSGAR